MPHPFRVFLRNGWDTHRIPVYTIPENSLMGRQSALLPTEALPAPAPGNAAGATPSCIL